MAFAVEISELASNIADIEIIPWASVFGSPVGTITWTYQSDSVAAVAAVSDQLLANADYLAKLQEGGPLFAGPAQDVLAEVAHVVGTGEPGSFASVLTAQCQPGRIVEAMTRAVEIQEESSRLTGLDGMVVRSLYGPFASVGWITPAKTIDQIGDLNAAFADPTFAKSVDGGGELCIPGNTVSQLTRRIS